MRGIKQKKIHVQVPSTIELCSLVLCFDLWIASLLILNLVTTFCLLSLLCMVLVLTTQSVPLEISH
jgi:hypothetical protein